MKVFFDRSHSVIIVIYVNLSPLKVIMHAVKS